MNFLFMVHYPVYSGHLPCRPPQSILLIALRADNKGEGGILALFALIRKKSSWAAILTMIGGSALLADGVITPSITVTSSIEGLKLYNPDIPVVPLVLIIFAVFFFVQQFGTQFYRKFLWSDYGDLVFNAGYFRFFKIN